MEDSADSRRGQLTLLLSWLGDSNPQTFSEHASVELASKRLDFMDLSQFRLDHSRSLQLILKQVSRRVRQCTAPFVCTTKSVT